MSFFYRNRKKIVSVLLLKIVCVDCVVNSQLCA